jgi:hypothetical protein
MRIDSGITDVTTAGSRARVLNTRERVLWARFTAPAANTGLTYVGDSAVSATNGYPLGAAGGVDATIEIPIPEGGSIRAEDFYVDAATDGDDVAWAFILA